MPERMKTRSFTGTSLRLKIGLAEMLKGGVIMDVMNVEQARIAEEAGATSVMALERVPAMIRAEGGVARMAKPSLIKQIIQAVSIPVMAKARIGHFAEAQILQELGVDFIDESEVLTPADEAHHIDKHAFTTPFVCGARNLGEALRRIAEGAAMIRTKGEAGTGDVVHAVQHMRQIVSEMKRADRALRAGTLRCRQGAPGSLRTDPHGGPDRQAAGAQLLCRRHRHPCRRCADDAARRRGHLCRVRDLHEGARCTAGRRE
jgi:pyridoxal biosynthesis lyase PdxS